MKNHETNKKHFEVNKNENITYQDPCNVAKTVCRGKFTAVNAYNKEEKTQINNLVLHLK